MKRFKFTDKTKDGGRKAPGRKIAPALGRSTATAVLDAISSPETSRRIDLVRQIRSGLPFRIVEGMATDYDITVNELVELGVIPRRTLSHSKQNQHFSPAQSDRAIRFFRAFQKAKLTFGSREKALLWLKRNTRALDGNAPVSLLDTEEGARLVEDLLVRIDHGLAA